MAQKIESKGEFVDLLNQLAEADHSKWENCDLGSYLEAMAAWLDDCEGFYANIDQPTDSKNPSWHMFGDALQAAITYE